MTQYIDLALALLAGANLLGVSGLYYRLGAAMQSHENVVRRQDLQHHDIARVNQRVTNLERNQRSTTNA